MNSRDLKLYSYMKSKGGGPTPPSPSVKWPRVIDYQWNSGARWQTSYTSKTFNLKKDDVVLICFASAYAQTFPTGCEVIATCTSGLILTIAKYVCTSDESRTFKVSQYKEDKMGEIFIQLRNCDLYPTTDFNSTGNGRSYTFPSTLPFIFLISNSEGSNSAEMGLNKVQSNGVYMITNGGSSTYCYIRVFLNFGTFNGVESYQIVGPGSLATTGVYLVDPTQE